MDLAGYTDVLQPQSTAVDTTALKVIKKYEHEFIYHHQSVKGCERAHFGLINCLL